MKKVLLLSLCVLVLSGLVGCREKRRVSFENDISEEIIDNSTESQISTGELEKTEITDKSAIEQVGSLEKSYTKNDEQITTHSGDIVLYSGDKIVVFYGSNSWAYTRLGKMNIPEDDVTELLSNGDITLKIAISSSISAFTIPKMQ